MSLIERELQLEIRDKKRTASGVHSKTGKKGYVGKMMFPTDLMSRKEKYNHRKAGKCIVSNIYDNILPWYQLKKLDKEEQIKYLTHWRKKYSTAEIEEGLGRSRANYYNLCSSLGITRNYVNSKVVEKVKKQVSAKVEDTAEILERIEPHTPAVEAKPLLDGLMLAYSGQYASDEICKKLKKLSLLLEDEDNKFDVEIKIRELK